MKVTEPRQQPVTGERRRGVDHQLVGLAVLLQAVNAHRQLLQQRLGGAEKVPAGIGEADAAPVAQEQRLFEVGLETADLLADRRLGDVQLLGGTVEAAQASGGLEAAQGVQGRPALEHN
nr:hypothetical protein [Halomonas nitroreducens]